MKNKRLLYARILLALLIPISIGLYLKLTKKGKDIETVDQEVVKEDIESQSAYYSKLDAYKEKERRKRNQSNVSVKIDSSLLFSNNQSGETEVKAENTKTKDRQGEEPVYMTQSIQEKPIQEKARAKHNAAFRQLAEVAKPKEEQATKQEQRAESSNSRQNNQSDRERRLQEMKSTWGNNTSKSAQKQSGYHKAVVHGTQELRSGQTVVLRTREAIKSGEIDIPGNTILNGILAIRNNRAEIRIASARVNNQVIPVQLQVFGMDGIAGLPLDQSTVSSETANEITREAVNEARKYGIAGKIAGSVVASVTREKKQTIILVDAQNLLLQ